MGDKWWNLFEVMLGRVTGLREATPPAVHRFVERRGNVCLPTAAAALNHAIAMRSAMMAPESAQAYTELAWAASDVLFSKGIPPFVPRQGMW